MQPRVPPLPVSKKKIKKKDWTHAQASGQKKMTENN
jgi:hypothetical protein